MSNRYKGGVISATPPTLVAGAGASGTWTLEQQMQATAAGLWPVNGPFYIEDVFSTYLYAGNDSTQSITNNIDISTKGALVWVKGRSGTYGTFDHTLITTPISNTTALSSNTTGDGFGIGASAFSPTTTGFNLNTASASLNNNGTNYASWTFRKQPKFFDIVTYTGTGSAQNIAHNLDSVPGCIIVKNLGALTNWAVYHRSLGGTYITRLNTSGASETGYENWANTDPTSTVFTVGNGNATNGSGYNYVAYVFAHNAGGFGLTGTDNVISCGSFTTGSDYTTAEVNLGYEPQWVMIKRVDSTSNWSIADIMRGMPGGNNFTHKTLLANTSAAEQDATVVSPNATGFSYNYLALNATYIYIAIRRGPMKVPTVGTSVFAPLARTGNGTATTVSNSGFTPDMVLSAPRTAGSSYGLAFLFDRLRGPLKMLETRTSQAEQSSVGTLTGFDTMNGYIVGTDAASYGAINTNSVTYINWNFRRAPSFFDEVCYTGNSTARTVNHNLGVAPELIIVKARSGTFAGNIDWFVYASPLGNSSRLLLNTTGALADGQPTWNSTTPTSSVFSLGTSDNINGTGYTYVAYLFATCAGVSKVGSYTGTGTTLQIDCGFTAGSRFVMIKRTDSTGDWYVWDSARGIIAGNDPYLLLNSTAAEVTNTDYVDTYNAGFEISSTAPAGINANGGTYIFLAIA